MTTLSSIALIDKIQTTIDGGCRVTLDFSANDINLAQELLKYKLQNDKVAVAFQRLGNGSSKDLKIEIEDIKI